MILLKIRDVRGRVWLLPVASCATALMDGGTETASIHELNEKAGPLHIKEAKVVTSDETV